MGRLVAAAVFLCALAGMLAAVWVSKASEVQAFASEPAGVMGTTCKLTIVAPRSKADQAAEALRLAEAALRDIEVHMSVRLPAAELARLNAAPAGQIVALSPETLGLLRLSRDIAAQSNGAFDVTCLPIIQAWAQAGKLGRLPTEADLAEARRATGWGNVELLESGARKLIDAAGVDLGGIAKGYGVDRAAETILKLGFSRGLANVGGEVRCFGDSAEEGYWRVGVQNPFDESMIAVLKLRDAAVSTSGNYRRFIELDGRRYSHIVDPRTGWVAEMTPSVTVVASRGAVADAWATALSVLGAEGIDLVPADAGIEAMVVVGTAEQHEIHITPGFQKLFLDWPSAKVNVRLRATSRPAAAGATENPAGGRNG